MSILKRIKTTPFELEVRESNNPLFSVGKIYVMHTGENPNGSYISKETVERNLKTISNIPIIGEFSVEAENFKGHGGEVLITEEGEMNYIHTTSPLGVVPESADIYWESITDKEGVEREYLVVDGIYMWNRYEKEVLALKEDEFGQSMEIEVDDYEFNEDENHIRIEDFSFSALCILGIDKNGAERVKPAFDDAKIITYSKNNFKDELSEMLQLFTETLNETEGGNSVTLDDVLEKYGITREDLDRVGIEYDGREPEAVEQDIKALLEEDENAFDPIGEGEVEGGEFEGGEDPQVDPEPKQDPEPKVQTGEPVKGGDELDGLKEEIKNLEKTNADLERDINSLKDDNAGLSKKVDDYEFEAHKRSIDELVDRFKSEYNLEDSDLEGLEIYEMKVESLESKLFEIMGRKAVYQAKDNKDKGNRLGFGLDSKSKNVPEYDALIKSVQDK